MPLLFFMPAALPPLRHCLRYFRHYFAACYAMMPAGMPPMLLYAFRYRAGLRHFDAHIIAADSDTMLVITPMLFT